MQKISEAIVSGSLEHIVEKSKQEMLDEQERIAEVLRDLGKTATVVAPYAPNRKQRRAQAATLRKNRSQ